MSDKKERKRELILDTAFELILENGYANTKIIDIANKAGIGKGTVYEYFKSKEALILELIDKRVRLDFAEVCQAMGQAPTCREKLTKYIQLEIETAEKYKTNVSDLQNEFINNNNSISMDVLNAVHSIVSSQFEAIRDVIKDGVDSGEFRRVDPFTASVCFMGSISLYLSLLQQGPPFARMGKSKHAHAPEDLTSFIDCVFNGLLG